MAVLHSTKKGRFTRSPRPRLDSFIMATALCAGLVAVPSSFAQQNNRSANRQDGRPSTTQTTLDLGKADQFLRLEATHPEEVRVDQPFKFEVKITNTSENVIFHDVKIGHRGDSGLEIESGELAPAAGQRPRATPTSAQRRSDAREPATQAPQSQPQEQEEQQEQQEQQQQSSDQQRRESSDETADQEQQEEQQPSEQQSAEQEQEEKQQQAEQEKKRQEEKQQEEKQQEAQQRQQAEQEQQHAHEASAQGQASGGASEGGYAKVWTIDALKPGETRVLRVTASSSQEGSVNACLALVSYTPSICLTTKFVKPELELVKRGPERISICDQLEYEYFVKNAGTGTIEQFTIADQLDEGLQTVEGDKQLKFTVEGGLKAGETRKFVAKLRPMREGSFSSRAIATDSEGSETRSQSVETRVVAPELAVAVDGPDAVYLDRPATYTVRVTNHGEAPAEMTRLVLHYPGNLRIARATRPQASEKAVERQAQSQQEQAGEQTQSEQQEAQNEAERNQGEQTAEQQQEQQEQQQQQQQQQQEEEEQQQQEQEQQQQQRQTAANQAQGAAAQGTRSQDWSIGTLEPGETRLVRVTFRAGQGTNLDLRAEALSFCGRDREMRTSLARATQQTEIISLPALMITVIDEKDPVPANGELTYRVVVANEGTAPDQNVRVAVKLPEKFEFVKAEGPTKAQAEGQNITFGPIEELKPGQEAMWRLRTKAQGDGNVALQASLESESLSRAVTADEPTTVFTSARAPDEAADGEQDSDDLERAKREQRESREENEERPPQQPREQTDDQ